MHIIHVKLQQLIYIDRNLWSSADGFQLHLLIRCVCLWESPEALGLIYSVWRRAGLRWSEVLAWEKREVAYAIDLEPEASLMFCWGVAFSWQPPEMQFHSHPSPTLSTRKYQGSQLPQRPEGANAARATLLAPSASGSIIMSACHWFASVHISTPEVFFFCLTLKQHYWGITGRQVAINDSSLHGLLGLFSLGLSQNQFCNGCFMRSTGINRIKWSFWV